jgi:hypothetical protein
MAYLFAKKQDNSADPDRRSDNGAKDLLPTDYSRFRAEADRIRQQRDQDKQHAGDNHDDTECSF